jgi:class 3 adenylate cyclase/predicted ATPase
LKPDIAEWLKAQQLEQFLPVFQEAQVDFETLQVLTEADLKELGLPFGPRKRILSALAERKASAANVAVAVEPAPDASERRQLTAMFCDLVGFTDLATTLDPEVLQKVIQIYEEACVECVNHFGGFVFQRLGDGIVAFFGFPQAHEDEAERAIRAGLLIIERMERLEAPEVKRLQVRIGLANGLVVVSWKDNSAVGETMNMAARLQGVAEPGSIVISDQVRRLASGAFQYVDLGYRTLKGIPQPARLFQVAGIRSVATRFEAATGERLTPLVGRTEEIQFLLERWSAARAGVGQVVMISGEPGIGKSRVLSTLLRRLDQTETTPLLYQCAPFHVNSAFYPLISSLERMLELERDEPAASKLNKLEAMVVRRYGRPSEDVHYLAAILSIPPAERAPQPQLGPKRLKEETVRALVDLAEATARAQPVLMLFEDIHWADPTTLEVLDMLIQRIESIPLLLVLSFRPEFEARWKTGDHIGAITLGRLSPEQSISLVDRIADGKALPRDLLEQIVARTDGVPLFVEELTKSILESGALRLEGDRYLYVESSKHVAIPSTLRDLLVARLDRHKGVKQVAQIGAAIGREFTYELVSAVAPMPKNALDDALEQLADAGLAYQEGVIPEATFTFKHALVQDAAYDSLLKSARRTLHGTIARALEERFPGFKETKPELLAHHYTEAGQPASAVPAWRKAGQLAMQRFALREADAHLRKGLSLIEHLPPGPERDAQELELRRLLGPAVVARYGWAAPEVTGILEPALALAKTIGCRKSYLPVLHGLWVHHLTSAHLERSRELAEELLSTAAQSKDEDLEICGHRAAMTSHFWIGNLVEARRHGDVIRALYHPEKHWHIANQTNSDPLTGDGIYRCQYLWMLGYPDQARDISLENHRHARTRNHPFDLAFALTLGSQVFEFRGEPEELWKYALDGEKVGREHGLPVMSDVLAEISKGLSCLTAGHLSDAVAFLEEGVARLRQTSQLIWAPYLRARWGEAVGLNGDLARGIALIDESLVQVAAQNERPHFAEILRLKAKLLSRQQLAPEAESLLLSAIEFARKQQSKSWELRAAIDLARLWVARSERACAFDLLAPVYEWFTEGHSTRDLREAKAFLKDLRTA